MKIINEKLLNEVSTQAKESPRLRMRSTYGRFACQRTITSISRWRISAMAGFAFLCRDSA